MCPARRQRLEADLAGRSASLEERQHAAALLAVQQAELQARGVARGQHAGPIRPLGLPPCSACLAVSVPPEPASHPPNPAQAYAAEVEREQRERLALEQRIRAMESKVGGAVRGGVHQGR